MYNFTDRCNFRALFGAIFFSIAGLIVLEAVFPMFREDVITDLVQYFGQLAFVFSIIAPFVFFNVSNCRIAFRFKDIANVNYICFMLLVSPLLVMVVFEVVFYFLGLEFTDRLNLEYVNIVWLFVFYAVLTPVVEEIIFRQILPSVLNVNFRLNFWISAIICSALFSAAHSEIGMHMYIFGFFMGLSFHIIRFWTRSLLLVCIAHGLYNFVAILIYTLAVN